jgi:UPF0176 protein
MLTVAAFYRFTRLEDPAGLCRDLAALCDGLGVRGSVILAREGINGTIAGPEPAVSAVVGRIAALPGCDGIEVKRSLAATPPFDRMKVRLRREIVTMGRPEADPSVAVGAYVEPAAWNALISAPDVAVIDTRNACEVAIGSFAGAIDPGLARFADFPAWWDRAKAGLAGRRIAMFCTGGIRCEKATALLRAEGVTEVHHLHGGILRYLAEVPETESAWRGACFVFDGRVSVGHGLGPGGHRLCRACGWPVAETGGACGCAAAQGGKGREGRNGADRAGLAGAEGRAGGHRAVADGRSGAGRQAV